MKYELVNRISVTILNAGMHSIRMQCDHLKGQYHEIFDPFFGKQYPPGSSDSWAKAV
jgi:hypothetical protein